MKFLNDFIAWLLARPPSEPQRIDDRSEAAPAGKLRMIAERYQQILSEEAASAQQHYVDPYWSSGKTNIGADEMGAVNFAHGIDCDPLKHDNAEDYLTSLIKQLLIQKKYYDEMTNLLDHDIDGYGAGTFWSIIKKLLQYCHTIGVRSRINPFNDKQD